MQSDTSGEGAIYQFRVMKYKKIEIPRPADADGDKYHLTMAQISPYALFSSGYSFGFVILSNRKRGDWENKA